jgi:hypothetical protein
LKIGRVVGEEVLKIIKSGQDVRWQERWAGRSVIVVGALLVAPRNPALEFRDVLLDVVEDALESLL